MTRKITADKLASALELFGDGIRILSLDCFDTLVWRSTYAPTDVFSDLDCGIRVRTWCESLQRQHNRVANRSGEVQIEEVLARCYPDESGEQLQTRVRQELLAEHSHCFGYAPACDLIRTAQARGLRIILVSDTYLSKAQLRALISYAAGPEIAAAIEEIFCSSEYGLAKAEGLFKRVLAQLKVPAASILHVGDNFVADYEAANVLSIRGLHIEQFPDTLAQRLRMEAATGIVMDPKLKEDRPLVLLHRAPLAAGWPAQPNAAARVGFGVLGPLLVAYAQWLAHELAQLQANGTSGAVRPLFLMRDGYMPLKVFARQPEAGRWNASAVEVSRFCAYAASFSNEAAILDYLSELGGTARFDALCKQLLFSDAEASTLTPAGESTQALQTFTETLLRPANRGKIIARSAAFAERLCAYLKTHAAVESGQTLVLADLGYAGTIQTRVAPVLREMLGVAVVGRYLLQRDMPGWRRDKAALFSPDHYDFRALDSLASYIAIVEQLCTAEQASCVDYSHDGVPIRKKGDFKTHQSARRQQAQTACMNYAEQWRNAFSRLPDAAGIDEIRTSAMALLTRLLFAPNSEECELFAGFEHDVNLGVSDKVTLFDPEAAHDGLLRRGLFYTNNNPRQYLPAELGKIGMDLSLNVLLLRRFSPDLRYPDFQGCSTSLPIMIADESQVIESVIQTTPTRDGYLLASVPIGTTRFSVGLKFGHLYDWLQLHSIDALPVADLMTNQEDRARLDITASAHFENIQVHAGNLLQCLNGEAFVFVPPVAQDTKNAWVLNVVFRPITARKTDVPPQPPHDAARTAALLVGH